MEFVNGDILQANTEAIVNTVNCVGYMGRGIAAQFKRMYPENFKAYAAACKRSEVVPGNMFVFETGPLEYPRFIVNFPTKRHFRAASRLEDVKAGLVALVHEVTTRGIESIAIPPLGCGLGGLSWTDVRPLIEQAFEPLRTVRTVVFEPHAGGATVAMSESNVVPSMTPGRALLVALMDRYLASMMYRSMSLLELHRLLYFAQEAGEPLRLRFAKALYGPYAQNLRHVLAVTEGHFTIGYHDGGDAPTKPIDVVLAAVPCARRCLDDHPATLDRTDRVLHLVDGFETLFGMELLATVHWVMAREDARGAAVVPLVHGWNERKRMFSEEQIRIAERRLIDHGWVGDR